ncbi:MAG: hypothetical protein WA323_09925 [Candidatus Nitrosopolaris sp.]
MTIYLTLERDNKRFKSDLRNFTIVLIGSIIVAVSLVILSNPESRKAADIIVLDITGATAVILGILVIYRHKFHGAYGKPFFCLTMGVFFWLAADITVSYYYFILLIKDVPPPVSFADVLWLVGYVFFALHLFIMLKIIRKTINIGIVVGTSVASVIFVTYTTTAHASLISSEFSRQHYLVFAVNISYPIADAILIIPAVSILVALRMDYEHSIPMLLASISLLINALADYGFVNDVMNDKTGNKWIWDLFFISDFLIIAAALYWYNRYYVTREIADRKGIRL